ncbi:hypothetical protein Dpoa569_0001327 [Dickeya poaceiphila]|uniref:Uncharacterized protein n=1 Tax=Dickeya poaceiphila TaxID=568768 RepID=A0A5B8IF11_9GAMM|nr:hypothetical protein Dpoa569_0001327 [Dickeya poaceiphila]
MQSQVNQFYAPAVKGDRASQNPVVYLPFNPRAENTVYVGQFVFAGSDNTQVKSSTSGSDAPVGFIERLLNYYNFTLTSGSTMTLPDNTSLTVAKIGEFYVTYDNSSVPTVGQKAFASKTNGSVHFAAAGATVSGFVETTFVCKGVDSTSGLAVISNWNPASA